MKAKIVNKFNALKIMSLLIFTALINTMYSSSYLALQPAEYITCERESVVQKVPVIIPESLGKVENDIEYLNLQAVEAITLETFEDLIKEESQTLLLVTGKDSHNNIVREYYIKSSWPSFDTDLITPLRNNIIKIEEVEVPALRVLTNGSVIDHSLRTINGVTYKLLQPIDSDLEFKDKACIIDGYEAINLDNIDIFSQESFKKILEDNSMFPLDIALVTTINNQGQKEREYYLLKDLRLYAEGSCSMVYLDYKGDKVLNNQGNPITDLDIYSAVMMRELPEEIASSYILKLKSPYNRQIIDSIKVVRISNKNTAPEVQDFELSREDISRERMVQDHLPKRYILRFDY